MILSRISCHVIVPALCVVLTDEKRGGMTQLETYLSAFILVGRSDMMIMTFDLLLNDVGYLKRRL